MGRNASSWAKITLFFVVFYLCLAAFFAGMLNAFLATMPPRKDGPKLTQYLAGKSPLRVAPWNKIKVFNKDKSDTYQKYVDQINEFLEPYRKQTGANKDGFLQQPCNFTSTESRSSGAKKQCYFDLANLGPCYSNAKDFTYGFKDGTPCFFLKMNKVFNFVPEPESGLSYTEVRCDEGEIYPKSTPGFPVSFFPYRGEDNWLAPIVALQLNTTSTTRVKCDVYGKNIKRSDTYLIERGAFNRVRIQIDKEVKY